METSDFLEQVGARLGIDANKIRSLFASLMSLINSEEAGLIGFLDRFRNAGLGDTISSWVGAESLPKTITPERLQSVLGTNTIGNFAAKAGVPISIASSGLAMLLPRLVQKVTANGIIPSRLPASLTSSISADADSVGDRVRQAKATAQRRGGWVPSILAATVLLILILLGSALWRSVHAHFNPQEQVRIASQRATAALESLKPGSSPQEIVSALNLFVVNFDSGGSQLPDNSLPFLGRAAEALKTSPAGTLIEVGGHTDNSGDETANQALSQERAEAVRNYLVHQGMPPEMLVSKGYGASKPVADNNTAEGRFRNRRIAFTVLQ